MIPKILSATAIFYVVWVVYFVFTAATNTVDTAILDQGYGSLAPLGGGQTVGQIMHSTYALFGAGIIITVLFLIFFLAAGSQAEEFDSGILGF